MKRYALGNKFYGGLSVPEIVEREDGEYVRYGDAVTALNELIQELNTTRAQSAGYFASCGHLTSLLDLKDSLLMDALAILKNLHESASPRDESSGDFNATIPAAAYRKFVDSYTELICNAHNFPAVIKQEQICIDVADGIRGGS